MVDTDRARTVLLEERNETEKRVAAQAGDVREISDLGTEATDDEHDPEGSTVSLERERVAALTAQGRDHISEIDAALQRIEDGTYGVCSVGGEQISAERLEALPWVDTCIDHAG